MVQTAAQLLYTAAEEGNTTEVARLTSRCNRTANGDALGRAALNGHVDCVKVLLPNSSLKSTKDGLLWAAAQGHLDCVKLLKGNNDVSSALFHAAGGGHTECVRFLLNYVDVTHKEHSDSAFKEHSDSALRLSALANAASKAHVECVRLLVEVSTLEQINHGLLCALDNGDTDCMQILYSRCDIAMVEEELNSDDWNPVMLERMENLKAWAQKRILEENVKTTQNGSTLTSSSRKI